VSPPPKAPRIRGLARELALKSAREWRIRMKPFFDELDAQGFFLDSPRRFGTPA